MMAVTRRLPRLSLEHAPFWLYIAALSFFLYYGVLAFSDVFRREPAGLQVRFGEDGATVARLVPGSPAAHAGLEVGDRIVRYVGRPVSTRLDWTAVDANLRPEDEVTVDVVRGGQAVHVVVQPGGPPLLRTLRFSTIVLWTARLVQLLCLVLATIVAFKRPHDRLARLGAWLLASLGVFTVVLPFGFAHYWRQLPFPLDLLMWPPWVSSMAVSALFFAFCSEFPEPITRRRTLVLSLCIPAVAVLGWHAYFGYLAVHEYARSSIGTDLSAAIVTLAATYVVAGLILLALQYRRLEDPGDRRRLRVLLAGAGAGCTAGALVEVQYWVRSTPQLTHSLFDSPATLVGVVLLLAFPASVAYAVLRHRVFGLRIIVRQGMRYALARRLLVSLVPMLLLAMVADLFAHRDESIVEILGMHGWLYVLLGAVLAITFVNRRRWLEALDRRFFRERYHAEQILKELAHQLREGQDPALATAAVVRQVERALKPSYVAALGGNEADAEYRILAGSGTVPGLAFVKPGSRLVQLARVVKHALELSPDHDPWIARHLPPDEASAVVAAQLELLIPVTFADTRHVVLVLGPKRSEEPYAAEDRDLLEAIASNLGLLLDRSPEAAVGTPALAECPVCSACFDTSLARCPRDSAILLASDLPPVLAGRYRLERRIGAGGMGSVYCARDEALGRTVAIKVIGEHLVGNAEAAQRFRREAHAAASFTHPNVVTIHDVGVTANARGFLVMERLEGRTLRDELTINGPLGPARVQHIVDDVCDVLELAHARGLVHRDLKPDNVFLARAGGAEVTKVLDFGIAKVLCRSDPGPSRGASTARGILVGSVPYMSPEQLRGDPVDAGWDLWALAVTAFEILTGDRPSGDTMGSWIARTTRPDRGTAVVALSPALERFFGAALSVDRTLRPRTAREFREGFGGALHGSG